MGIEIPFQFVPSLKPSSSLDKICIHISKFLFFLIIFEQILHIQRETWAFKSSLLTSCFVEQVS